MRIDPFRRRRGELSMEAMLVLPVVIVIILLARLILEGMLVRQEVAVFTRSSTASAALAESTFPLDCMSDRTPFSERPAVTQAALVLCQERRAEQGLRSQREFWPAIRQGAQAWPRLLDDVYQSDTVMDMEGDGRGTTTFVSPNFLRQIGLMTTESYALFPQGEVWWHGDDPMRASYDPVIWQALRERNTWKLFPEVFPARDG